MSQHGTEILEALLDEHVGRADRRLAVHLVEFVERGADHALRRIDEETEQVEQHRRRRRERQGHVGLADVVHRKRALHLGRLHRLGLDVLPALGRASFELYAGL
jgi:hypothetical protein